MAEVAAAIVGLRIPVVGQLDLRCALLLGAAGIVGRGEEDEREATLLALLAPDLFEPELADPEIEGAIDVLDAPPSCADSAWFSPGDLEWRATNVCRRGDDPSPTSFRGAASETGTGVPFFPSMSPIPGGRRSRTLVPALASE